MSQPKIGPEEHGDLRYYRRPFNSRLIWDLQHAPRRRLFDRFMRTLRPQESESVLDLGCAALPEPQENIFELYYPHKHRITAAGTEDASFLEARYPGLRFVRLPPDGRLPFPDDAFDVGFSNAVIEHAGSRARQALFLREFIRVCRRGFLATPNRWFPVELHTRMPFLHWLPAPAFRALLRAMGMTFYAQEENLNLLTASELLGMLPAGAFKTATLARHRFLGLTSNLVLTVEKA